VGTPQLFGLCPFAFFDEARKLSMDAVGKICVKAHLIFVAGMVQYCTRMRARDVAHDVGEQGQRVTPGQLDHKDVELGVGAPPFSWVAE
jgi:hypothetical protein